MSVSRKEIKKCLICQAKFEAYPSELKLGKGKFCSKSCSAKYKIVHKDFGFKKGYVPKTAWKKGDSRVSGENNHLWKGDNVGLTALHDWVRGKLGRPKECAYCGSEKHMNWANVSHEYKRDLTDWMPLCRKCHHEYDQISIKVQITKSKRHDEFLGKGMTQW